MSRPRWVLHLPTTLTDQQAAVDLAVALRDSLAHVTVLDFGELTLSPEDDQHRRTRIWCDRALGGGRRCERADGHDDPCMPAGRRH